MSRVYEAVINRPGRTAGPRNAAWLPGPRSGPKPWQSSSAVMGPSLDPAQPFLHFSFHEKKLKPVCLEMLWSVPEQAPGEDKKCSLLQGTEQRQPYSHIIRV